MVAAMPADGDKFRRLELREHDASKVSAEMLERLDRIGIKMLERLENEVDRLPYNFLTVGAAIVLDKRRDLIAATAQTMTVRQTISVNGLSRADAMALASGERTLGDVADRSQATVTVTQEVTKSAPQAPQALPVASDPPLSLSASAPGLKFPQVAR